MVLRPEFVETQRDPSAARSPAPPERAGHDRGLRTTWPLGWWDAGRFVGAWAVLVALFAGIGELVVGSGRDNAIVDTDRRVAEWFVPRRTERLDSLSWLGSMLADTVVKIVVTAVIVGVMLWLWRRWFEPLIVATALILEASAFITITTLVGRPRPDVPRLESSPVNSSFPSGHTAAAAAYFAIVLVVAWRSRRVWLPVVLTVLVVAVVAAVGGGRMYRGMHFLSDVLAGVVLGAASVALAVLIVTRAQRRLDPSFHAGSERS